MARRIRILGLFVLLLVGTTSLMALPDHEIEIDYYTDATLTEWCGYKYILCYSTGQGGCRTSYFTVYHGPDC